MSDPGSIMNTYEGSAPPLPSSIMNVYEGSTPKAPAVVSNDVSIIVGTNQIAGWQSVEIVRSAEAFPNHFTLTMTEQYSNDPSKILVNPGARCQVKIGSDVVVTGFIDRYTASIGPNSHDVTVTGRGLCEDLVDCSADIRSPGSPVVGGSTNGLLNILELAQKLCKPWGITARLGAGAAGDAGLPIRVFQVALGEPPYEIIERVARYAGYLVYEDELGALVLDRVGTAQMDSGFVQGEHVEHASVTLAVDQRFTTIDIVFSPIDQLYEGIGPDGAPVTNQRAYAADPKLAAMGRFRPLIEVSQQTDGTYDFAQRLANWEIARLRGRSQAVHVVCDKWRDEKNRLWTPNMLAPVHLPALKLVNATWVIGTVQFRKDTSGTHAAVTLMPPEAFSVQPSPLNVWDYELNAPAPKSQSPAPPTTTAPASMTGPGGLQGHV
jgi:prophage tail gpP-like protein